MNGLERVELTRYRYMDRHGFCTWWYCALRTEQVIVLRIAIFYHQSRPNRFDSGACASA